MATLRAILCPVDFSDASRYALGWAAALAACEKSRLTVVTAVDPLLAEAARARMRLDLVTEETMPALREFVDATIPPDAPWAPALTLDARVGKAHDVILEAAAREGSDLVVMGTRGLGGIRKLVLGSTTAHVLRRASTPVLAVPPVPAPAVTMDSGGVRIEVGRLLAATDLSDASNVALEMAADIARQLHLPLVLVHAVEPIVVADQWTGYLGEFDDTRIARARTALEQLQAGLCSGLTCDAVVERGRAADAIAAAAVSHQAGAIVVGLTGGQGGWAPRPGSTAYQVLCLSQTPVLVVPPRPPSSDSPP